MKRIRTFLFITVLFFLSYSSSVLSDPMYYEDNDSYIEEEYGHSEETYPVEQEYVSELPDSYDESRESVQKGVEAPPLDDYDGGSYSSSFNSRLPKDAQTHGEKVIIVNPRLHVWGAYSSDGKLLRAGLATAGSTWCRDLGRSCRTKVGSFRIGSLGAHNCVSSKYPLGRGGAPMPYCMYFNGNQGIHGSNAVAEANLSHGCVRVTVADAEWIRFHFATIGTKVIVMHY